MAGDVTIITLGDSRVFLQKEGISPANAFEYFGCTSLGEPDQDQGQPDPVYCPSPSKRNAWDIVDQIPKPQGLGSVDFTHRVSRALTDAWFDLRQKRCAFNMQIVIGRCSRPDDIDQWESKIALKNARIAKMKLFEVNPLGGDKNAEANISGSLSFQDFYPIRPLNFQERADAVTLAEVLDGLYNDTVNCGDCGAASDGCKRQFWLTKSNTGSPGLSSQIVYSSDGYNYSTVDIPTMGGSSGVSLVAVGRYLVVLQNSTNQHHYAPMDDIVNGTPTWTKVTSGYVTAKGPIKAWSKSPSRTFVASKGGYIYLLTDPTKAPTVLTDGSVSTQDLNYISGYGAVVVAVGGSNAMLVSKNNGVSFSLVIGPAVGQTLNTVWCVTENVWLVGAANGHAYFTVNQGRAWTDVGLESDVAAVQDIRMYDDLVGYMATTTGAGAARVYRTTTGGYSWSYIAPSIANLPDSGRINAICPCGPNLVGAGGIRRVSTDGLIAIAN